MQRFLRLLPSRSSSLRGVWAPTHSIVAAASASDPLPLLAMTTTPHLLGAVRAASKKGGGGGSPYRVSPDQRFGGGGGGRDGGGRGGGGNSGGGGGGRGGGNSGGGGGGNMVKLQICHSDYDLEPEPEDYDDEEEDMLFTKARFDMKDISQKVEEVFDSSKNLEYYENGAWKPLRDLGNLQKYKGGKVPLKVRVPELYDDSAQMDEDGDDDDDYKFNEDDEDEDYDYARDGMDDDFGGASRTSVMEETITDLVTLLKNSGYERSDVKPLTLRVISSGKDMATKDWVLQQAEKDPNLESVLLGHVGALDHVVQCLHYDMVWKTANKETPALSDGKEEKE